MTDLPPPPDAAGFSLSSAEPYVITAAENAALCAAAGTRPDPDGSAHPIWFFVATQVGMGSTVEGICRACDFDVADGPMMGSSEVTFSRPLRVGEPYRVSGEIASLVRKRSRKLGVMDVLEYRLRLALADGTPVLATTNTWVLPRRHLA